MKNKNLLNLSKSLPGKLLLTLALIIGWGNFAWAQKTLPYAYGFENNDLDTEGWTKSNAHNNSAIQNYSSRTGTYCFRFYVNDTPPQYLISPKLSSTTNGIELSFYYKGGYATTPVSFNVGYCLDNDFSIGNCTWLDEVTSTNSSSYSQYQTTINKQVTYIVIRYNSTLPSGGSATNYNLIIDDFSVISNDPYPTPSDFIATNVTGTSATLSWTQAKNETAWRIRYSTDADFEPENDEGVTVDYSYDSSYSYTLNGLTSGVTYYASITADYGGGQYSTNWSDKIEFTPQNEITINDENIAGQYSNSAIPIYGYKADYDFKSQFIIPYGSLTSIQNTNITQLKFYSYNLSVNWNAKFDVYLNETTQGTSTTYGSVTFGEWGTKVCSEKSLSTDANGVMTIELDEPFKYGTGNIVVGLQSTSTGSSGTSYWYAVPSSNCAVYYYYLNSSYTTTRGSYLPKMTFTTVSPTVSVTLGDNGYTTFASPRPLDLTAANLPTGLKAYKAAVNGTTVNFTEINQAVPANTGILLEGTAGQTYAIPVADSGTTPEGNAFEVNSTGGTFAAESGYTCYGLKKNSDPLVFATFDPATVAIPTNKAYLKVANTSARELTCTFDDVTGISTVNHDAKADGQYFNLAGQRVAQPVKGLYIVNGRKVVMK